MERRVRALGPERGREVVEFSDRQSREVVLRGTDPGTVVQRERSRVAAGDEEDPLVRERGHAHVPEGWVVAVLDDDPESARAHVERHDRRPRRADA